MWLFDVFKGQAIDVIRWENPNSETLVWKWPHNLDEIKDKSSLIVDPGLAAIFVHNGKIEAIETKPGKWSLETDNIPFISSLKNYMSAFETHDKSAVFFVKTNNISNQKWWTPNSVTYIDSVYDFPVELRAFGNFTFVVSDIENFWVNYVANAAQVATDDVRMLITDRIVGNISEAFAQNKMSYNDIDAHTTDIAKQLTEATKNDFTKLGLKLVDFRIEDINFTDKTNGFIDQITEKSANVWAINKTANIDKTAMANYAELEKLNIMNTAAQSGWSAGDMMWAWMWMAMGMNMAGNMNQVPAWPQEQTIEQKLEKLKSLLDKELISKEDFEAKKSEILSQM